MTIELKELNTPLVVSWRTVLIKGRNVYHFSLLRGLKIIYHSLLNSWIKPFFLVESHGEISREYEAALFRTKKGIKWMEITGVIFPKRDVGIEIVMDKYEPIKRIKK